MNDWGGQTRLALQQACRDRGLPTSGTKAELVDRLTDHQPGPPKYALGGLVEELTPLPAVDLTGPAAPHGFDQVGRRAYQAVRQLPDSGYTDEWAAGQAQQIDRQVVDAGLGIRHPAYRSGWGPDNTAVFLIHTRR